MLILLIVLIFLTARGLIDSLYSYKSTPVEQRLGSASEARANVYILALLVLTLILIYST